jgi:predicted AAA+ superfamily ATPase
MKQSSLEISLRNRFKEGFTHIQVILGPRQVGKTTAILKVLEDYKGPHHYVSAETKLNPSVDWIHEVWQEALSRDPNCLLVIDEIQKIPHWSERIKTLWDSQARKKLSSLKLILLGSSSVQIQRGLSESLTGRFEMTRAFHWGLDEIQLIKKLSLEDYLVYGGYPGSYQFIGKSSRFQNYIQSSIVETVIEKDLLTLGRVRNPSLFKQTFELLQRLPAAEISYTKLLGQLQDKGNTDLVKGYLDLFQGAFLITQVHKFNNKAFKSKVSTPKIICMAPALLDYQQKASSDFLGLCFESLVGADLLRAGLSVYYWREGDYEIDFVIKLKGKLMGIEVKTNKKKSSKSVGEFKKVYSEAEVAYVNYENYSSFAKDPEAYLAKFV